MPLKTANWRVQQSNAASLVRSFLLAGAVTSAICVTFLSSNQFNACSIWLVSIIILSIALPLAFAKKYLSYRKSEHLIILDSKSLTIPTPMMKDRIIDLSKIKSFETLHYFNKPKGLWIGLLDGSSELIDAGFFESQAAFEDFTQKLISHTTQNNPNTSNNISAPRVESINNNDKTMRCAVFAVFATYAITTASGLKEITDSALEIGALTKSTFLLPELYRISSSFFLHSDSNHFLLNIFCLIFIGRNVDIILGKFRFCGILFGSALAGSLLSLLYSESDYVIGASGGIMGLLGVYSVICLKYQHCIQGSVSTSAKRIFFALFLQMALDLTVKGIDVFSHVGGFLFGAMYAIFFLHEHEPNRISSYSPVEAVISIAVGSLYLIGLSYFLLKYQ